MPALCVNTVVFLIEFLIEFLKMYLAVVVLLKIKQRKTIGISFLIAITALIFSAPFFDFADFGFIGGIVVIGLLAGNACDKKKIGMIILSYIGISIIDMIFSSVCIGVFHLDYHMIKEVGLLHVGFNLFSLLLLLLVCFILGRKRKQYQPVLIKKYIVLYFLCGIFLSLYLTAVQFMGMGESQSVYGRDLAIGMSLSSLVLVALCVLLIINSNRNEHLKRETEITAELLEAQKKYYTMLLEKENETSAFRHDIKQHLYCMNNLYNNNRYEELGKYLVDMNDMVKELSPRIQTGNSLITAIVNDISGKFPEVHLQWTGMVTEELHLSSSDLCTVFYNLLLNAFEAVRENGESRVEVDIKFMESTMMITIRNPIRQTPQLVDGDFVTSKREAGHGYGIKNVRKCVEKNGGLYSAVCENGFFVTDVIFPNAL